jgi:conjugal transfer pilus assembly protein TraU
MSLIDDVCWDCMLPLKIAGIPILPGSMPDKDYGAVNMPICMCPFPPPVFVRYGVPVSYYEAARIVEVVKNPYCFPTMGLDLSSISTEGQLQGTKGDGHDRQRTFFQAHELVFPVFAILEILVDWICVEDTAIDMFYMTEIDPLWNDDMLAALINPEALLFGNHIANLACIADSIAAQVDMPLDPLFWCKGSWGNAYPLTGNTHSKAYIEDSAPVAAGYIYAAHRKFFMWDAFGYLCAKTPNPIWTKSAERMQLLAPVAHPTAMGIGKTDLLWGYGKNPPFLGDNFGYLLFRKRECCAF